jgi:16S rRNA (uracil1498-N3)-methyltransferase
VTAVPAWPPKSRPRLFVRKPLELGVTVEVDSAQVNYLGNVLRMGEGDALLLFDGRSGEWLARIASAGKKRMSLAVETKTRDAEAVPDVWLAFAPVKRAQTDWLVEKATEIGAARLIPVITARTNVDRVKVERLESIAIEAAEQCRRTVVPEICEPLSLVSFLAGRPEERTLYFADEQGGETVQRALRASPAAILTGPEGGFTDEERVLIRSQPSAVAVSLGPRILRAETAALAALTAYMAVAGDWR